MNVQIFVDGSCLNNGQPDASAGWSVVIKGNIENRMYGKLPGKTQTNNRAELYALLKALQWVKDHPEAKAAIYSDSKVAIDGLLGNSQRKANRDIWAEIEALFPEIAEQIIDIKHIVREENREADELARKAANALIIL